jgi:Zn-dependent protease
MRTEIPLGRIAGVEIFADLSLILIFVLITFSLATGVFPYWHPQWSAGLTWLTALTAAILFFASVLLHELSHALVGRARGVSIRRITLFLFGGMAQMDNEPPSWRSELYMALVGPLTSLVLGGAFLALAGWLGAGIELDLNYPGAVLASLGPLATLLLWLGTINIILAVFNLVPGFPLDGGRVLRAVMWGITGDLQRATRWASGAGQVFAALLMAAGAAMVLGLRVPVFGSGWLNGLWMILIGWFLNNAAVVSYKQLLVREALDDVPVGRLMQTQFTSVSPDMPVDALIEEHVMASGQRIFPVARDGRFLGLVCLRDLQRRRGAMTRVQDVMTPRGQLVTTTPKQSAAEAMSLLGRHGVNQLPVLEGDRLVGLLRGEDVLKWLALRGTHGAGSAPPAPLAR